MGLEAINLFWLLLFFVYFCGMTWTDENKAKAIQLILDQISSGYSLKSIIDTRTRNEVPCYATWCDWLKEDKQLLNNYARACEERAEKIFDEIFEIADDKNQDIKIAEDGSKIQNSEFIARSRLRVDARKWALSKMNPKKYGERMQHANDPENPITNVSILNIDPLSDDATDNSTS